MSGNLDFSLIKYENYTEYLKSFIKTEDYNYLSNMSTVKKFVKLGYRSAGKVVEEDEFYRIKSQATAFLNPTISLTLLYGRFFKGTDGALQALVNREEANLQHKISTIIFIQARQRSGFDLSGYIDFESSLRNCTYNKPDRTNWKAVFEGKTLLRPKPSDLSYYDWHKGIVCHNDTDNFHPISGAESLAFMHKSDHKLIPVTDKPSKHSKNVERTMIISELYGYIILYDHIVR